MTSIKLGLRRLERLAKILDMADALHKTRKEPTYNQRATVHGCGTPACAIGHYAAHTPRRWVFDRDERQVRWRETDSDDFLEAAVLEFGISFGDAVELFGCAGCGDAQTAKQAARYIRSFIARTRKDIEA